ncbi:restriction endonuclease subunit S [Bellilinea sp.]|uniref:restriction endonuclease subunit S n=1 Tax=Bellilinea sp. TaxID=2838785 RepID=UPI002ADDBFAF|nr:restriction endonuclease subunit S [Bellilinea sp.]
MASEWREVRLVEVAEIIMGQSPPGETYNAHGDGLPFFQGVADFNYRHPTPRVFCSAASRVALPGDILLSVRAPIGRVNVADRECAIGRGLAIIRPKKPHDARYIEFVLRYLEPYWHTVEGGGSVFGNATRQDLERLGLGWPSATERHAIAHILGTLDDKIELNRKMSRTLEDMARALFKAWFVDFEPVRAKTEGRWRRGESLPGLPAHLYDLFPDRLVDSELGEIPEGWRVGRLGDIAENPRRSKQPEEIAPGTPYIGLEHMPRRSIALSEWGAADNLESNKFEFKREEILFGKLRPYFHKVGVAPVNGVCSTDIVVLTSREHSWFGFVLGHISSEEFVEYTNAGSTGTKMPRTNWSDMARYELVLPPDPVVGAFTTLIQPMIEQIIRGIQESRTLAALRDTLLPKLIRGEIRVKDAERFLKERGL